MAMLRAPAPAAAAATHQEGRRRAMRCGLCRNPTVHPSARRRLAAAAASASASAAAAPQTTTPPILLLQTTNKRCLTTALEAGRLTAAVFTRDALDLAKAWRKLARFEALLLLDDGEEEEGKLVPCGGDGATQPSVVGRWARVPDAAALRAAEASLASVGAQAGLQYVVMDAMPDLPSSSSSSSSAAAAAAPSWRVIPSENLVAFAQQQPWWRRPGSAVRLLATCATAAEAAVLLGSLEAGTDGVVLRTDEPSEVRAACAALDARARASSPPLLSSRRPPSSLSLSGAENADALPASRRQQKQQQQQQRHPVYESAVVTRVEPVGMADRACVDLACALLPGEGLLVGCFARALFLVHSERDDAGYVPARPFRVNAGPLAQYVLSSAGDGGSSGGGGRTSYLSELRCGQTVAVAGADGRLAREAVVARVKVESRPVVLVEVEMDEGEEEEGGGTPQRHAVLLQNAETVKLVGPATSDGDAANEADGTAWRTVSVAELAPGDRVYVLRQPAARHTGLAIDEGVSER